MAKKPFEIWFEMMQSGVRSLKVHHDKMDTAACKQIFNHMLHHINLGWAIVSNEVPSLVHKLRTSSMYGRLGQDGARMERQEEINKQAAERINAAEQAWKWWRSEERFKLFARYVAQLLHASPVLPLAVLFEKLAESIKSKGRWKKIWASGPLGPNRYPEFFARSVAILVKSNMKNVTAVSDAEINQHNLSLLIADVEKVLHAKGFDVGKGVPVNKPVKKTKKSAKGGGK